MKFKLFKMKKLLLLSVIILSFTSCMMTKTPVGKYTETPGQEYTYSKGKQFWLFWGAIPVGRTSLSTPTDGVCQVVTKYRIGDILISGLTGGIVTSYSIKIEAKKAQ